MDLVIKRYRPEAIAKHAALADLPLAEFEFRRNLACFSVPGLEQNVARPVAYHVGKDGQWVIQQRLKGELCLDSSGNWSTEQWSSLRERLLELVVCAHDAQLYDLDLHPGNIMLVDSGTRQEPLLFDFNLVPFTERRKLTLDGMLYRLGLMDATYRDLRRLRKRFQ